MPSELSDLLKERRSKTWSGPDGDDPRLSLLARVVASEHFARSPQLVKFLQYICRQVVAGTSEGINEQLIGTEVFGRPFGYDSHDDNIVRAHASRLRQKLNVYFSNEGRAEPLKIVVPRGSYVPAFCENGEANSGTVPESLPAPMEAVLTLPAGQENSPHVEPANRTTLIWRHWLATVLCCLLCIAITWFVIARRQSAIATSPAEPNHILWSALGQTGHLLIVPADSSLVLYNNVTSHTISISEYISGQYRIQPSPESLITSDELGTIARRRLTSIVDLQVSNRILRRPEMPRDANQVSVVYARDLRLDDLKEGNAVLIGSQEANPWIQLFDNSLNFNIIPDQKTKVFTIVNRNPQPGEQSQYVSDFLSSAHAAYALVSCVPNLSGKGYVLLIQGTGMAGTEAAADFVLGNGDLTNLLRKNGATGDSLPRFELLLETSNLSGNAPSAKIIAYRIRS